MSGLVLLNEFFSIWPPHRTFIIQGFVRSLRVRNGPSGASIGVQSGQSH